ncbi:AT-rich interactive domain-containing protein 4B-like isoform X1 [Biomphalaria glabrata]|uniref:AT-rich interactive domain-containing protein 4B-like isoform X1 n=1 Tax=Biomphalaria glabrata TaxID=6526 RepID=A0A9W3A076_BIOGL|nr:AT-rich interactive domain-containing protein 4B-like isoform X1 [Biomphalaria glabrata]
METKQAQQGFGPPSLPVGTEVSAKYRGAFCEAKVKNVVRVVKCKVALKDGQSSVFVNDEDIKGTIKLGSVVEVKHPETSQYVEATINKLIDHSSYTVVFDDGDERTLRRTQLCLKGDKHFIESETLDNLPLSHPEHFGTPVLQNKKAKRRQDDESGEEEETSEEESPRRATYRGRHQELVGKLMLVELPHRKGSVIPALVVLPDANSLNEVKNRDQILVRSFKDSKFMVVTRKELKDFSRAAVIKNEDKTMRTAIEKALLYFDTKELPVGWNKDEMLGSDLEEEEEGEGDNEYASEDEPFEEKDRFVAQLYKFMDDRGTPINKGPCIGNKDLNLYKLFKIVQNLGGYNKVTKEMKWAVVYSKMGLPSLHQNPAHQIRTAYKKYLDAYETFYRKLGSTMGTLSRPGRGRQNSSRSILNFRGRERSPRSPKPPEKSKEKEESETSKRKVEASPEKVEEEVEAVTTVSTADESDVVTRRTPRREPKTQPIKEEKKEDTTKTKKEDKKEDMKTKKEDKKEEKGKKETPVQAGKKEIPVQAGKKETPVQAGQNKEEKGKEDGKKEEIKKEDKKSAKKPKIEEENDKEDKKPDKTVKKEEDKKPDKTVKKEDDKKVDLKLEMTPTTVAEKDSPKKRVTRRKLLTSDSKSDVEAKEEEDKKEILKKTAGKEKKEIPKTLERREKSAEKKETMVKKELKSADKKPKMSEEKKIKKEKKIKDDNGDGPPDLNPSIPSSGQSEDEADAEKVVTDPKLDFPIGSKLRVKYGRGKNQKIYIAKVVDFGKDGVHKTYLVHYAGWNTRYDEWIRPDRVVSVLDKPSDGGESKSKSSLLKQARLTGGPKMSSSCKSASQVFRAPKIAGAQTRATRSSSSDTCVVSKHSDKMVTRRGSVLADSTGSVLADSTGSISPESQLSSDTEENTGSEPEDGDTKSEKEEDEDDEILNVDEEFDEDREKFSDPDTSLDETSPHTDASPDMTASPHISASPHTTASERVEDAQCEPELKESLEEESVEEMSTESLIAVPEVKNESPDKGDNDKKSQETAKKVPSESKHERPSVHVSEITQAVDEIRSAVYEENLDQTHQPEDNTETKVVDTEPLEAQEVLPVLKEEKTECFDEKTLKEDLSVSDQVKPNSHEELVSPKLDISEEAESKESDKPKRGRKKETLSKDLKKSFKSDISSPSVQSDVTLPTEQPVPVVDTVTSKVEPSPYDFDGDADVPPWQPEITKKWEPSSKVQIKDIPSDDGVDKDKKKVKKKVKRKIVPEAESNIKSVEEGLSSSSLKEDSQTSGADNSTEKPIVKKKGRKKKESVPEVKKDIVDQYESTVNSVVEAVKHSLLETESDPEPSVKRRRVKRASESDKKDNVVRVNRMGRKVSSRDSLETSFSLESQESKSLTHCNSETLKTLQLTETAGPSSSLSLPGTDTDNFKNKRKDTNFPESQGFEPQSEQEASAHFENTPPTTPEHDEESCGQANAYSSRELAAKVDVSSSSPPTCILLPTSSESPSDNDVTSTASTDTLPLPPPQSEGSGTDQEMSVKRRKVAEETLCHSKKKKRIHGTRSRTAQKSPKYVGNSDSQGSASNTPIHCPESPSNKFPDITKSPRPSKFNFSADLGEYLEGEARCNFLISKMREIKAIYMNLKSEVASIDRRRKRAKRKERECSQMSASEKETST